MLHLFGAILCGRGRGPARGAPWHATKNMKASRKSLHSCRASEALTCPRVRHGASESRCRPWPAAPSSCADCEAKVPRGIPSPCACKPSGLRVPFTFLRSKSHRQASFPLSRQCQRLPQTVHRLRVFMCFPESLSFQSCGPLCLWQCQRSASNCNDI